MKDPELTRKYLKELFQSIVKQTSSNWMLHLVHDQELGDFLPQHSQTKHHIVNFEPKCDPRTSVDLQSYFNDFRLDKGLRVYEAYKSLNANDFFMVIDDDDLIHCELAECVSRYFEKKQLIILKRGYEYQDSIGKLLKLDQFDRECGTSIIAQANAYTIFGKDKPNSSDYVELGSHTLIKKRFSSQKTKVIHLQKRLAVYRTQHSNSSTSQINHIRNRKLLNRFKTFCSNFSFRRVNRSILRTEFGQF